MLCKVTHCAGCVSADTRPHKLCQCDQEMGTAILSHKNLLESVSAHVHTHKFNHLANSIHSSMNSLETDNEYFPKPTSVRNRPGYIRTAATVSALPIL